jgi:GntR family transcriptional regulator, transcriptional repressor for pyruvate dehydrogenase complex
MEDMPADPMTESDGPVRLPKAAEIVAGRIRRDVATGRLKPGQTLPPEPFLLQTLGVGRPALREALRILEVEGLLSVRRGNRGGAVIETPKLATAARASGLYLQANGTRIDDIYEARLILEPAAAGRAAKFADDDELDRLRGVLAEEFAAVNDANAWAHAAVRFHEAVVELAHLKTLTLFTGILSEIINAHQERTVAGRETDITGRSKASRAHKKLLDHIVNGDSAAAEAHWHRHIEATNTRYFSSGAAELVIDLFNA